MLSREADACYWIGRYVERAEATARMVDVHYHTALESNRTLFAWSSLLSVADAVDAFSERGFQMTDESVLAYFCFDQDNSDSIIRSWTAARENARTIRDEIASEMWEALNVTYLELGRWNIQLLLRRSPSTFFSYVKESAHRFQGTLDRTLMDGEAKEWINLGRFVERGDQTTRLLDVKYHDLLPALQQAQNFGGSTQTQSSIPDPFGIGGPLDEHGWASILRSVSAFEMFRKTHRDGITPVNVVDFLVLNARFPASIRYCIAQSTQSLSRIKAAGATPRGHEADRIAGRLLADLTYTRANEIIASGLHEFLQQGQERINALGDAIAQEYLTY